MGKVAFPEHEEWEQLRKERAENQQKFSKDLAKISRTEKLEKKRNNHRNSLNNLSAVLKVGLSDSIEDRAKIVEHLLDIGDKIRVEHEGKLHRSKLDAPLGTLTIRPPLPPPNIGGERGGRN
jgi:predicted transcriptional regulator